MGFGLCRYGVRVAESCDGGRQLRARYAFGGATVELERTVPLAPGEQVLLQGVMRLAGHGRLTRPVLLRLTRSRLVVLAHFALRPDQVWDLPRSAVRDVGLTGRRLQIVWVDERNLRQVLQLSRWTGRAAPDRPVRDAQEALEHLSNWLAGRDDGGHMPRSHEAH